MSDQQKQRRYAPLVGKQFKSTIPPHLVERLPEEERYLVETMSKLESQGEWLQDAATQNNRDLLDVDQRLLALETSTAHHDIQLQGQDKVLTPMVDKLDKIGEWKTLMTGKWGIVGVSALILIPIILKFLLDHLVKKGP
jgi:uncharacterized coiled-coil protein SlyX